MKHVGGSCGVVDEVGTCTCLGHDHADPVRDDVVELARDPGSLLRHCQPRLLFAFPLEPLRTALEDRDALPAPSHVTTNEPGDRERQPRCRPRAMTAVEESRPSEI